MDNQRCETCRFWDWHEYDTVLGHTEDTEWNGWCRRYPPVFDVGVDIESDDNAAWTQPVTMKHDWCGEYQPLPPTENPVVVTSTLDLNQP